MMSVTLPGFQRTTFPFAGIARDIYRAGSGPGVVVLHELPGMTPQVVSFGRRVADAGFSCVMPVMFGRAGKPLSTGYFAGQFARICISREFRVLAARRASPLTDWLRALCRQVHSECGGPGVGVVGMCVTGKFALSLMADESVMAPVASQPSLPLPVWPSLRCAIGISDEELAAVKHRAAEGGRLLGLRFSCDRLCPAERFEALKRKLGPSFEAIEIDSSPGNPHGISPTAHCVLTVDFVDQEGHPTRVALDRVLGFLRERLSET